MQDARLANGVRLLVVPNDETPTVTIRAMFAMGQRDEPPGKAGLASLTTAALFLVALFFAPVVTMVGGYPPLTAPALVLVGAMMLRSVRRIEWSDTTEALPAFLILIGIPLSYSISDGLAPPSR